VLTYAAPKLLVAGIKRDIVPLLGHGLEQNNAEAIISWVAKRYHAKEEEQLQLDSLENELRHDLEIAVNRSRLN
jgi:hypothetical protein